jgi:hypothetical protein
MKLTTDYREQAVGALKGSKEYYLVGTVEFTNEEHTVAQERGLYDIYVNVPAATAPPTRGGDFLSMVMRGVGLILAPIGLLSSCAGSLSGSHSAGPLGMLVFFAGLGLFIVGKLRDRAAYQRVANPEQPLSLRRLMANPHFECHAFTLDEARSFEHEVREALGILANRLRDNIVVPEKNTYEL